MLSKVPSECPTSQCRKEENGIVVAGSRRGPTLLHLPTDKTLTGTTLMIRVLANQGGEVFRELSNKETYRKNENGAVYEYLSGTANSAYEGAYKGFDLFGEIVPLPAPTT
ncbi:MAG: hypothetical protein LBG59_03400 [Candidatus Peribacteria bacterium]|jgi:hypothetical protein|nr:hypothetical protein [Candidatus Peribacteria bacterium]